MTNPNRAFNPKKDFRDSPGQQVDPPWEPFWDCMSFATDDCVGDCDNCDAPMDEIDYLCEAKW